MQPVYGQQNRQHLEAWLKEIGEPTTDEDAADKIIDAALEHSWKSANVPALADWVRQNEKPLDLLVDASRKPNYYLPSPSLLDGGGGSLNTMSLTGVQAMRNAARALTCRAMWHLGENRPGKAWQDILAVHRLGRLTGQGRSLVEQLVAIAIVGIAADATVTLLDEGHLTSDQTQQIERDLATLSRPSCMADSFDGLERMTFLEAFFWAKKDGFGTLISASEAEPQTGRFRILNAVSIDWNVALREGNRWYDRISAAARIPNWADRQKAFANINYDIQIAQSAMRQPGSWVGGLFSRPKRSELIAAVVVGMFIPATTAATNAEDRNSTQLQLMQLASAIADYRAKHGHYPDRLEELIPDIIAQLPVDLYHNKPFVFRRDGDGYLLYSTGENGQDDGGSNEQMQILAGHSLDDLPDDERQAKAKEIPVGADDIAIRMPRPAFEWPKPAAK
jgi:type II secretory pathway pseudopilin PulG